MERELLLLGLLKQQEMHGYQLHEFIDGFMQTCVDLKKSTAYYLLDKMARKGWVAAEEEREGKRPLRQVYHLTPTGEKRYEELLRQNLAAYLPARFGGDVGIIFLDDVPVTERLALLQTRRQKITATLKSAQQIPPHTGSLQWVVDHHIVHLQSELDWLDEIIRRLTTNET